MTLQGASVLKDSSQKAILEAKMAANYLVSAFKDIIIMELLCVENLYSRLLRKFKSEQFKLTESF
jgi:hypothetical protein